MRQIGVSPSRVMLYQVQGGTPWRSMHLLTAAPKAGSARDRARSVNEGLQRVVETAAVSQRRPG